MATLYLMVVGLPAILIGVTIFWFVFERPFMRRPKVRRKNQPISYGVRQRAVVQVREHTRQTVGASKR